MSDNQTTTAPQNDDVVFASMTPEDRHAYLTDTDPGYRSMSPEDQQAYSQYRVLQGAKQNIAQYPTKQESHPIGSLVPQAATPAMSAIANSAPIKKSEEIAQKGAEVGGEIGEGAATAIHAVTHPTQTLGRLGAYMPGAGPKPTMRSMEDLTKEESPNLYGGLQGAGEFVGGMADPRQAALIMASGGLGEAMPFLSKAIAGGFAAQMGTQSVEEAKDLKQNWNKYTPAQRANLLTKLGLGAAATVGAAAHATPEAVKTGASRAGTAMVRGAGHVAEAATTPAIVGGTAGAAVDAGLTKLGIPAHGAAELAGGYMGRSLAEQAGKNPNAPLVRFPRMTQFGKEPVPQELGPITERPAAPEVGPQTEGVAQQQQDLKAIQAEKETREPAPAPEQPKAEQPQEPQETPGMKVLRESYEKAYNEYQKALATRQAYAASEQQGVPAPAHVVKAYDKAHQALIEAEFHMDAAKESGQPKAEAAPEAPLEPNKFVRGGQQDLPGGGVMGKPLQLNAAPETPKAAEPPQGEVLPPEDPHAGVQALRAKMTPAKMQAGLYDQPVEAAPAPEAPVTEKPRMQQPDQTPEHVKKIGDLTREGLGGTELKPNVPLKEQVPAQPPVEEKISSRPDKAVLQKAKASPETTEKLLKLSNVELRQLAINAGEDMGQESIGRGKQSGSTGREQVLERLLKNHSTEDLGKMVDDGKHLPTVGGGSQAATETDQRGANTEEAVAKENDWFNRAKQEKPDASLSEQLQYAQELKNKAQGPKENTVAKDLESYNESIGKPKPDTTKVVKDPRAVEVADAYEAMKHDPENPQVKKAYTALKTETKSQWEHLKDQGYTMDLSEKDPYSNYEDMAKDVKDNKHISVYDGKESHPPADHPMSEIDPETGLTYNSLFRAVHDIMGHAAGDNDFSERGEENAYNLHRQAYSDRAVPALTTETKGQTSTFFNNKEVREGAEPGKFPEQKANLLPKETYENGPQQIDAAKAKEVVDHIKSGKDFAVLQAENPQNNRVSDAKNAELTNKLFKELKSKGYDPVAVGGNTKDVEGTTEHAFFVPDITPEEAVKMGKAYDQVGILTNKGLHDLNTGSINPIKEGEPLKTGDAARGEQYYTTVGNEDFHVPVDMDKTIPKASMETARMSDAELEKAGFTKEQIENGEHLPTVSGSNISRAEAEKLADKHLEEGEQFGNKSGRANFIKNLMKMPSVQEVTDIAKAGEVGKEWYQRSTKAFDALMKAAPRYFQEADREKFINFVAALSPQQSVKMNLQEALSTWTKYVDMGRPEGKPLQNMLKGELTVQGAKVGNAMKALAGESQWPDLSNNRNFKVPSFGENLRGFLNRVTNDGWQAAFSGIPDSKLATAAQYHPISVVTRAAAEALGWEPAEAQAAIWAFTKMLTEHGETLPEDVLKYSEDFADLMAHDNDIRSQLEELGVPLGELDEHLKQIQQKPEVSEGASPTTENSVGKLRSRLEKLGRDIPKAKDSGLFEKSDAAAKNAFFKPREEGTDFNPENEEPVKFTKSDADSFIDKFEKTSGLKDSPEHEGELISDKGTSIRLNSVTNPNRVRVSDIRSLEKGKGGATEVMKKLTSLADRENTPLELTASSSGEKGGLSQDQLYAFYEKHGFERQPDHSGVFSFDGSELGQTMIREPKQPSVSGGSQAATAPAKAPITQKLIAKYGTTDNAMAPAQFIDSEGNRIPVQDHDRAVAAVMDKKVNPDDRIGYMNDEKAVRVRFRSGQAGKEVVFSIPDKVSPEQIKQMEKTVAGLGQFGTMHVEQAQHGGNYTSRVNAKSDMVRDAVNQVNRPIKMSSYPTQMRDFRQ